MTIANHVHLIEPHWNPMAEAQAVDRVHRIGQTREVVITRYIARKTIEEVSFPLGLKVQGFLKSEFFRKHFASLTNSNSIFNGFRRIK